MSAQLHAPTPPGGTSALRVWAGATFHVSDVSQALLPETSPLPSHPLNTSQTRQLYINVIKLFLFIFYMSIMIALVKPSNDYLRSVLLWIYILKVTVKEVKSFFYSHYFIIFILIYFAFARFGIFFNILLILNMSRTYFAGTKFYLFTRI